MPFLKADCEKRVKKSADAAKAKMEAAKKKMNVAEKKLTGVKAKASALQKKIDQGGLAVPQDGPVNASVAAPNAVVRAARARNLAKSPARASVAARVRNAVPVVAVN